MRYPRGIPAGLVAIAFGMLVAWGAAVLGLRGRRHEPRRADGRLLELRLLAADPGDRPRVQDGFKYLGVILVTAIPFGIYDLVEAMDNVESAEAAGDHYPTTRVLTADGVVSLIGCLMGNPFINAVYIGHPGWKSMGGRIGYSFATGVMVIVLCWFGIIAVMLALVPVVAISPILLYIGMLIGAQAFQTTPSSHAPAVVLGAAAAPRGLGADAGQRRARRRRGAGHAGAHRRDGDATACSTRGCTSSAAARSSRAWCSPRSRSSSSSGKFETAAVFALVGAVLTFFGFMHGEAVGFNVTPMVALAYVIVAGFLYRLRPARRRRRRGAGPQSDATPAE